MKTFLAVIRMCRVNVRLGASPPCNIVIAIGKTLRNTLRASSLLSS